MRKHFIALLAGLPLVALGAALAQDETDPNTMSSDRDLAAFAERQHPGSKWGYVRVPDATGDDTEEIVAKIPDSAADGTSFDAPVSSGAMNAANKDFWRTVRGNIRRGQGEDGTDAYEVIAVYHGASGSDFGPDWTRTAGWFELQETVPLIH